MKVVPIEGEHTCFSVQSRTLQCNKCFRKFTDNPKTVLNQRCPACKTGLIKTTFPHKVDIAHFFPVGECACKGFQIHEQKDMKTSRRKELESMPLSKRLLLSFEEQERLRCPHIKAARNFALNRDIWHFEKQRLKAGNGRKETDAP
jgi:hypothetical protein